jgi:hypothetical protein
MKAFRSRRPWIVSLVGYPSFSLNSEANVRLVISRSSAAVRKRICRVEIMPRNNPTGKANSARTRRDRRLGDAVTV